MTESIVQVVQGDGHVSCIPGIRVPDGNDDGEGEGCAQEAVAISKTCDGKKGSRKHQSATGYEMKGDEGVL